MTPNDIEFLIHCYCSLEVHERIDAPAIKSAINWMLEERLIDSNGNNIYRATPRGIAHIEQLCQLPLPKEAFLRFDGVEIQSFKGES